jgi:hypothetical protein
MRNFSILKVDDEYSLNERHSGKYRLDPLAVLPHQSGVTTTPLDGVSVSTCCTILNILRLYIQ